MYQVGDKLVLHSENGHDYSVEIVNINEFRSPDEIYGVDIYDDKNVYYGDVYFCGKDFLDKCERI